MPAWNMAFRLWAELDERDVCKMDAPLIGIIPSLDDSTKYTLASNYCCAISRAGGIPLILPYEILKNGESFVQTLNLVDGLLLSGGGDPDPTLYGQSPSPRLGRVLRVRDEVEIRAVKLVRELNKPILGICRGMQVLNVAFGGDLYQDIPSQRPSAIQHDQLEPRDRPSHSVRIIADGILADCGRRLRYPAAPFDILVNSFHHQAVRNLPEGFKCVAMSADGIIEAIESTNEPFVVGVQWHPERMFEHDDFSSEIFRSFVEASRKSRRDGSDGHG